MSLTVATYLGENTVVAVAELVQRLCSAGLDVEVADGARSSDDARRDAPQIDLVWLCGALYDDLRRAGRLDHDVIGVPVFDGETAPEYHSVVVTRVDGPSSLDEALEGVVAINEPASWSGHRALRRHVSPRWFAGEVETGSHAASLGTVSDGRAGCAAIDHTIWNATPVADRAAVRVIDRTRSWPAPPLVLRRGLEPSVRSAVVDVVLTGARLPGIVRFEPGDAEWYEVMR